MRLLDPPDGDYERDCVMYLRKSKGNTGIARQRRENEAHARRRRWRIVAEFIDTDKTAFNHVLADAKVVRDDYEAMIKMLQADNREVPLGVLSWHADRLHREVGEAKGFAVVCATGRHLVETPMSGSYDLNTATGRKRFIADALDAESEVDHMSERHLSDKMDAVLLGRWLGGPVPFGWRAVRLDNEEDDRKVLELVAAQADAIAWASEEVLIKGSAFSLNAAGREWNSQGLRRNGRGSRDRAERERQGLDPRPLWNAVEVRRVLRRPRNAALMEHNGQIVQTVLPGGKAEWPEIIDEEMWRAVDAILGDPDRRKTPGPTPRWLGSGKYRCGATLLDGSRCGATMRATNSGTHSFNEDGSRIHARAYRCRAAGTGGVRHVSRDAAMLDDYVEIVLVERLQRPDVRRWMAVQEPSDLPRLRAELEIEGKAMAAWEVEAKKPGAIASLVTSGAAATQARIDELKEKIAAATVSPLLSELASADNIAGLWERRRSDLEWRRAALELFVVVTVLPSMKGHPVGWQRGKAVFDTRAVKFDWKPLGGRPAPT